MKQWHRSRSLQEAAYFGFRGIAQVFTREHNVRIQAAIGTLVVCAMIFFRMPLPHMAIIIVAVILVITLEMINTSLELLCDRVHPEYSEHIKGAKDIAAGAVVLATIGACLVGVLLFAPLVVYP